MANEAEAARAAPVISSVSPASGTIGDEVTITGSGFAGATGVTFGAAASEFTVKSASQVTATVPAGAAAGPVTVTGPGGTASSREPFTVTPGITLSPASGPPAATVMVAGAGFGAREVVDIYLGTADQALAIAGDTGNFAGITVQVPASAVLGPAYLTAAGRHSGLGAQAQFLVRNLVTVASPGTLPFVINQPGECQIQASDTASGQTLTYTATGLPPGLSINPATGLISGIPTAAGSFAVTVTAQDTTGASGSATFEADVYAVTVTSPGDQVTTAGTAVSLQIQASTSVAVPTLDYSATGLPPGLSMGFKTGLISGTPTAAGSYLVTVTVAAPTVGTYGSTRFSWAVN